MIDASLKEKSALIIGLGGLGCPAALSLARAGVGRLVLCDDDRVDESNLHRQILFGQADVGRDKLDAARDALINEGAHAVELVRSRFLPENSRTLVKGVDCVLEGADNFPTKFLAADTCFLEEKPVIHGACVRFVGTAWSVAPEGRPCYRCLFEDLLPEGVAPNCSGAGVFGPVVGVVGALMADLAIDTLLGLADRTGRVFSFDGKRELLRETSVGPRPECPLCALNPSAKKISTICRELYTSEGPIEARLNPNPNPSSAHLSE